MTFANFPLFSALGAGRGVVQVSPILRKMGDILQEAGKTKVSTSTAAALFSKMALTGQRIAMVNVVLLVFPAFPYLPERSREPECPSEDFLFLLSGWWWWIFSSFLGSPKRLTLYLVSPPPGQCIRWMPLPLPLFPKESVGREGRHFVYLPGTLSRERRFTGYIAIPKHTSG